MKIHAMSGWDFPTTTIGGSGASSGRGPIPNTMFEIFATNGDEVISAQVDANGWLRQTTTIVATNWGNWRNRIGGNLKTAIPTIGPTSNLFHGIRHKVIAVSPDTQLVSYMNSFDAGGTNALTVFSKSDLPGYALTNPVKEYYLEHQLDFVNSVVNRWVDGKALTPLPMPAFMPTAVSAVPAGQELWLALGALVSSNVSQGTPAYHCWRDMYYVEYEAGEKPQPLGSVIIDKLPIAAVDASAWAPTNPAAGTVTSALKTGYSNPSSGVTTPLVISDAAMSPAAITYDATSIPLNAKVKAVCVKERGVVTAATTGNLGVSLTVGGVETADVNIAHNATQAYFDKVYSSDKNPSGQPWTQPNLAGLTVKAKPKV